MSSSFERKSTSQAASGAASSDGDVDLLPQLKEQLLLATTNYKQLEANVTTLAAQMGQILNEMRLLTQMVEKLATIR